MNLPKLENLQVKDLVVLLRADLDAGETLESEDVERFKVSFPTIEYLLSLQAKVVLIGHRGRPEGVKVESLSLRPISEFFGKLLSKKIRFVDDVVGEKVKEEIKNLGNQEIMMLENLRFDPREESNDPGFAKELSSLGEIFVNEAFASSHREHASIVGLPRLLPHAAGMHLDLEVKNLSRVLENPQRPVVVIISGVKEDKLSYVEPFERFADKILIAGTLPEYIEKLSISNSQVAIDEKILVAQLNQDKEDITIHSAEMFEEEIGKAGTVVLSGPIGKFEDEAHMAGTKRVFEAVAKSSAFKIAGGGDTQKAISMLGLKDKFDWISVGGGAMLEFLAKGTLPGIEALLS